MEFDSDIIVRKEGNYVYNDCGVCLNPNKHILYEGPKGFILANTAKVGKLWIYGYEYLLGPETDYDGYFSPVSLSKKTKRLENEDDAIRCAINELKRLIKKERHQPIINKIVANNLQLKLF